MSSMMQAAVLVAPGRFAIEHVPLPSPGRGEVQIAVTSCGVCMSDVGSWKPLGPLRAVPPFPAAFDVLDWSFDRPAAPVFPRRLGHEMTGVVAGLGPAVRGLRVGDRVTGLARDALADACVLPADRVVALPDNVDVRTALGEPISCVVNASTRARVAQGDAVVLLGSGFMNLLVLQLLRLRRPRVIVAVDVRADTLEVAGSLGADVTIDGSAPDIRDRLLGALGPGGADVVIEGTGRSEGLDLAGRIAAVRGRIIVVSFHRGDPRPTDLEIWAIKGLDVVNAHERDPRAYMRGMRAGVRLLEQGLLDVAPVISHRYGLSSIQDAFEAATTKPSGFLKAVVDMDRHRS